MKHAAQRKLGDEMSLTDVDLQPAGYSVNTRRDPRGPTATFVFTSVVDMTEVQPTLPDDAKALAWFPIRSDCIDDGGQETLDIFGEDTISTTTSSSDHASDDGCLTVPLAFDHDRILESQVLPSLQSLLYPTNNWLSINA